MSEERSSGGGPHGGVVSDPLKEKAQEWLTAFGLVRPPPSNRRQSSSMRALESGLADLLRSVADEARREGSTWMLNSVRASLSAYPNGGGDIEVMREVERLRAEARREEAAEWEPLLRDCRTVLANSMAAEVARGWSPDTAEHALLDQVDEILRRRGVKP